MVEALLFDLGGVLIDIDFERIVRAWAGYSALPVDEIRRRFRVDATYERLERGELDSADFVAHLRRHLRLDATDQQIIAGWNAVFVGEIGETVALVRAARQVMPCFAFSNTNPIHQRAWSRAYPGVVTLFDEVFVSSELGLRKPELRAYRAVAERMQTAPGSILFFDDLDENVAGARQAGLRAVRVQRPDDLRQGLRQAGVRLPPTQG